MSSVARVKRTCSRRNLTRIINDCPENLSDESFNLVSLKVALERAEAAFKELSEAEAAFETACPEEISESDVEASLEYKDKAVSHIAKLKLEIERRGHLVSTVPACPQPVAAPSAAPAFKSYPKVELRKFGGKRSDWLPFFESFKATIHEEQSIPVVTKFQLLQQSLYGSAANVIAGLPPTSANYDTALDLLEKRYGDTQLLQQEHLGNLSNISKCQSANDIYALRKIFDTATLNVRALKTLGVSEEVLGSTLFLIFNRVLPQDILVRYQREKGASTSFLHTSGLALLDFLGSEITFNERCRQQTPKPAAAANQQSRPREAPRKPSAALLHVSGANSGDKRSTDCFLCDSKKHKTEQCDAALSLEEKKDKLRGRCFKCTAPNHMSRQCRKNIECTKCKGRHATTLCDPSQRRASTSQQNSTTNLHVASVAPSVLLQTAVVWAKGNKIPFQLRLLFDGGSQQSFITEKAAKLLQCKSIGSRTLSLETFGNREPANEFQQTEFQIWSRYAANAQRFSVQALVVPHICDAQFTTESTKEYLPDFELADNLDNESPIDVLIGCDYLWQLTSNETVRIPNSGAVAIKTAFGWTLTGVFGQTASTSTIVRNFYISAQSIDDTMKKFWELDAIGISAKENLPNDFNVDTYRQNSVCKIDERYEIKLPWKPDSPLPSNNLETANTRLSSLTRRLLHHPTALDQYHSTVEDYLSQGIIERVSTISDHPRCSYYMPHRGIYKDENLTTKLRIVFDASSHQANYPSLNDCLYAGPNLNPDLISVLINFRTHRVAITADIARAFLQVGIDIDDRDYLRFLWYDAPPRVNQPLPSVICYRFCRLPFGVTSSPFVLAVVIRELLNKWRSIYPRTVALIENSLYVDDLLIGAETTSEALQIYQEAKEIFIDGSMQLHKWGSNDTTFRMSITSHDGVVHEHEFATSSAVLKVLGLIWLPNDDRLSFNLSSVLNFIDKRSDTKRFLLQATSRIFDPLGFIAPFVLRAKILFQQLWEQNVNWDDRLPEAILAAWTLWCSELHLLTDFSIPRAYHNFRPDVNYELHIFCDASPKAYGAVAYLRISDTAGNICVTLVSSKSRVAPLKALTVPRLELMGAVIATRFANFIEQSFNVRLSATTFWTDSAIVLAWIKGNLADWKPFVGNRLNEIKRCTSPAQWFHVAGIDNPADLVTRGISANDLISSCLWRSGPTWLSEQADKWPQGDPSLCAKLDDVMCERRSQTRIAMTTNVQPVLEDPIDSTKFSSLSRLHRTTAFVFRFISNLKERVNKGAGATGPLTRDELLKAERYWVKQTQQKHYSAAISDLRAGRQLSRLDKLHQFRPLLDQDGVVRITGRLQHLLAPEATRHPILLPKDDHYSSLLVISAHLRLLHAGVEHVMSDLRERFWISGLRSLTRKLIRRCTVCLRYHARAATAPTAPLPASRVNETAPFDVIGVDFGGPLITNKQRKCYICLITCAVTRAVHLELVENLKTETFFRAFRRFTSRRGVPRVVYSDNALTFKRAASDLLLLHLQQVSKLYLSGSIEWRFNAPLAPWWGGFFERLMQSVKLTLKKVLGRASLSLDELATVLCEAEAVINCRPLTYQDGSEVDLLPLCPSDFLTAGRRLTSLPDPGKMIGSLPKEDATAFRRRWALRQRLLASFWKRFRQEYLLRLRSANIAGTCKKNNFKVNDVVLVEDKNCSRLEWRMGRITAIYEGRDGEIRSISLKCNGQEIRRPVQGVYPMEL